MKVLILLAVLSCDCLSQSLATLQANYIAQKCGSFIIWNMTTFQPNSNVGAPGWATPNQSVNVFAPPVSASALQSNIDIWMTSTVAAGCKYASLTAKHHDGFSLWPTAFFVTASSPYSVAQTSWYAANGNPDIILMFVNSARSHGINPVIYFSIWDRTMEARDSNCTPGAGSQSAPCYADYLTMIEMELTELLSNYGAITAIYTDGWGWKYGHTSIPYSTIYAFIKSLQPNCLLIENDHASSLASSDIVAYEVPNGDVISTTSVPSEAADIIKQLDNYWFYNPGVAASYIAINMQSPRYIYEKMNFWNNHSANYLLALTPDSSGAIPAPEKESYNNWTSELLYASDIAFNKTAISSTNSGASLSTLMDKVLFVADAGAVTTSSSDTSPYMEIDVGSSQPVSRVEIFNNTGLNGSSGRLRDLTVSLYDNSHVQIWQTTGINTANAGYGVYVGDGTYFFGPGQLTVTVPYMAARYIRVSRTPDSAPDTSDARLLSLLEIEAFARPIAPACSGPCSVFK